MSRYIDYDAIDYRNDRLHDKSEEFLNGVIYMAQRIDEAPSIDIVHCSECKLNPKKPRQYSDPDPVEFYLWCEMFADADGYCPFGK